MRNKSRYFIFLAGLLFTGLMSAFLFYSNYPETLKLDGINFKKSGDLTINAFSAKDKKAEVRIDTTLLNASAIPKIDTSPHKILLIGDSQVEGLRIPFYDYCIKNKHTLLLAATWYSSTDMLFASNDTLKNIINRYKPDYIVMVIGLNEIFTKNMQPCEQAVKNILTVFNSIPFAWIGPANWMPDKGINDMYQRVVPPGCFFPSKNLVLQRSRDNRHPSEMGNKIWMDSIAYWLNTKAYHHLKMEVPDSIVKNKNINDWMQLAK
jgi:hypothetical protein